MWIDYINKCKIKGSASIKCDLESSALYYKFVRLFLYAKAFPYKKMTIMEERER